LIIIRTYLASQDGLLSAWSTMTGIRLAAFYFNHHLVKLHVSQSGGTDNKLNLSYLTFFLIARYAAILQNTPCVAMLSLFNIPSSDASKITHRHSQSMLNL
jgi:hypothetical protein